jgi:GAF domain-containing protein
MAFKAPLQSQIFADLGRFNVQALDLAQLLQHVTDMAHHALLGAAEVSLTLIQDDRPRTVATTGGVAVELDVAQYQNDSGPCLSAAQLGETLVIGDVATEDRWPTFTPAAVRNGVHSTLSISLPVQQPLIGSLNLYATAPYAFDDEDVATARAFAGYAAVAIANAHLYASTSAVAAQMEEAMRSRAVI